MGKKSKIYKNAIILLFVLFSCVGFWFCGMTDTSAQTPTGRLVGMEVGEIVNSTTVAFQVEVNDNDASEIYPKNLKVEVELQEYQNLFNEDPEYIHSSETVTYKGGTPPEVTVWVSGLTHGQGYKWRVRVVNVDTNVKSDWMDYGNNSPVNDADFFVTTVASIYANANTSSINMNAPVSLSIDAYDGLGQIDQSYRGHVSISVDTSDVVINVSEYTFQVSDNGEVTLSDALYFTYPGDYVITVRDTENLDLVDTINISVLLTSDNYPLVVPLLQRNCEGDTVNVGAGISRQSMSFVVQLINTQYPQDAQVQIEIVNKDSAFTGSNLYSASSVDLTAGQTTNIVLSLPETSFNYDTGYKWRARYVKSNSYTSGWVEYGDNVGDNADFVILPLQLCGNGIVEIGEQCDGGLGSLTCSDFGDYNAGSLSCNSQCNYDVSNCFERQEAVCGNGIVETGEQCDGSANDFTCSSFGDFTGVVTCNSNCLLDTSQCVSSNPTSTTTSTPSVNGTPMSISGPYCGNGIVEAGEQCDTNTGALTCESFESFNAGVLFCNSLCKLDTSACFAKDVNTQSICGNGFIESGEQCDTETLPPLKCADFVPRTEGRLTCNSLCQISSALCMESHSTDTIADNLSSDKVGMSISDFFDTNESSINIASTTGGFAVMLAELFLLDMGISNIPGFFVKLITKFLILIGLRKEGNGLGKVYDSLTGEPIPLAIIRVFDPDNKLVMTSVTDVYGYYRLALRPGRYYLMVNRNGYIFPTEKRLVERLLSAGDVYKGKFFTCKNDTELDFLIPMDPKDHTRTIAEMRSSAMYKFSNIIVTFSAIVFFCGMIFAILNALVNSSSYTVANLFLYLGILIMWMYNYNKYSWRYGKLGDKDGNPLAGVQIDLLDIEFNRPRGYRITNSHGLYRFVVQPGKYILKPEKGDNKVEVEIECKSKPSIIARDIVV